MAKETQYYIHNTSKDRGTRVTRVLAPGNPKTRLFLGGGSLAVLRGRPVLVEETALRRYVPELIDYEARGLAKVTNIKGMRVGLTTLAPLKPETKKPELPPAPAGGTGATGGIGETDDSVVPQPDPNKPAELGVWEAAPEATPAPPAESPVEEPAPAAEESVQEAPTEEPPAEEPAAEEPAAEAPVEEPASADSGEEPVVEASEEEAVDEGGVPPEGAPSGPQGDNPPAPQRQAKKKARRNNRR